MLEPNDRRLLLESLRPPEGFELDFAVATTFSLDLTALLTTPVAFTFYDWEHEDGRPVVEPLALLEALSRHADRLAIFCQADRILVPRQAHGLFAFLEDRVFPVHAPSAGGVFHPKVWSLRYTDPANAVRYRLLVSSRNLTFDRSWDTLLVLDGELEDRKVGHRYLRPLGEFFAALPGLGRVPEAVSRRVGALAEEIRRVRFDLPEHVDEVAFWPLGLGVGPDWPFRETGRRLLVVSPFVTGDCLGRLADVADDRVLISEATELAKLERKALAPMQDVRVLSPAAQAAEPEAASEDDAEVAGGLSGLHAKLYVLDQGRQARVWTGSANATAAAFGRNVELLAELVGPKGRIGVDALLAERRGEPSFASLLEPYVPTPEPERDEAGEALSQLVESARRTLGAAPLVLYVTPGAEEETFSLELRGPQPGIEARGAEIRVVCRPITLGEGQAATVDLNQPVGVVFPRISFEALTSFVAFTVSAKRETRVLEERFVLNLPLEGAPAGRPQRIIQNLLRDQRSVLRFILMLLADDVDLSAAEFAKGGEGTGSFALGFGEDTVLESLLRALVREPRRLDRVAQLLKDLLSGDAPPTLPEAFAGIWSAVWSARQAGAP